MTNLNTFTFNATEIFRSNSPMPVTALRPWKKRGSEEVMGSLISVVIPARNFATLTVKVAGSSAYEQADHEITLSAAFKGLVVRPYALKGAQGEIVSGWTATADSVELSEGAEFL